MIAHDIYKYSNNIKHYLKFSNLHAKCKDVRNRDYTLRIKIHKMQLKQVLNIFGNL